MTALPTQPLNTGSAMPLVGLGLWKIGRDVVADTVVEAIRAGYRHLDSACDYGNEKEVGIGIRRAIEEGLCTREELWVTSKLWNTFHAKEHVRPALERTLEDLGLDYLDLYLVHFPIALAHVPFETRYPPEWVHDPGAEVPTMRESNVPLEETWHAMEALFARELVHAIGVCNYNVALLRDLLNYARIPPAVLQVESHPYLAQERLLRFCREQDVAVTAYSPLGALSYVELDMAEGGRGGHRAGGRAPHRRDPRADPGAGGAALGHPAGHLDHPEDEPPGAAGRERGAVRLLALGGRDGGDHRARSGPAVQRSRPLRRGRLQHLLPHLRLSDAPA